MIFNYSNFLTFLFCSYAVGWILVAMRARKYGVVDLCQFVRSFLLAPIFLAIGMLGTLVIGGFLWFIVIPNLFHILVVLTFLIDACLILGVFGYFIVQPMVKKAYGVALPFSEKICIVLYRRKY